ncbi:AAA family ATPase [Leekyejoonella antrihumi]|uniref:MinD/ParA family protein n=1 Tax=Leekyejoonella antrihumi TaxID=1660198 RepID=A0A563E213_9MICO|nr:AAA family ATPase [Leekyejoonella antrihumi]TWP35944.1 MinD/ParA family protein [Leekyejoonella antrihumi]
MSSLVVIGCADQTLGYELRSQLDEVGDIEIGYIAESTIEFSEAVLRLDPDVAILHDALGPHAPIDLLRDLSLRRPAMATLIVCSDTSSDVLVPLMEAGARGVLSHPLAFEEVRTRIKAAIDWASAMERMVRNTRDDSSTGGARIICFTGSKGGVGTSTIATHLALDVVREVPGHRVALLDLDLEKGDVSSLIDVRYRTSIADIAKISDDLSIRTVTDAVVPHESGVHLLLTPPSVQDVEYITPHAVRVILTFLRQAYDLVIVDGGSHVTPTQVAVVELADEVIITTTPDVLSLRGVRRTLDSWQDLGVRKPEMSRVLVNNSNKQNTIQADVVQRLAQAPVISIALPSLHRQLEAAVNSRDPLSVHDRSWWKALRAIGKEIALVQAPARKDIAAQAITDDITSRKGRRKAHQVRRHGRKSANSELGQLTIELVGLLPAIFLVAAFIWQIGLVGMTFMWASYAADAAARQASIGKAPGPAAEARVPSYFRDGMSVDPSSSAPTSGRVDVSVRVPVLAPGLLNSPWSVRIDRTVVVEP